MKKTLPSNFFSLPDGGFIQENGQSAILPGSFHDPNQPMPVESKNQENMLADARLFNEKSVEYDLEQQLEKDGLDTMKKQYGSDFDFEDETYRSKLVKKLTDEKISNFTGEKARASMMEAVRNEFGFLESIGGYHGKVIAYDGLTVNDLTDESLPENTDYNHHTMATSKITAMKKFAEKHSTPEIDYHKNVDGFIKSLKSSENGGGQMFLKIGWKSLINPLTVLSVGFCAAWVAGIMVYHYQDFKLFEAVHETPILLSEAESKAKYAELKEAYESKYLVAQTSDDDDEDEL